MNLMLGLDEDATLADPGAARELRSSSSSAARSSGARRSPRSRPTWPPSPRAASASSSCTAAGRRRRELQKRLGQTPKQVAGRRVTDAATLDVMKMVVAGKVNVDLCAALWRGRRASRSACTARARALIEAERRPPRVFAGAGPDPVDFGLVGDVTGVNAELLELLARAGYVPVLACLGADADGAVYNINADTVANRVAIALDAEGLVLVSDVPGVLRDVADPASRIARLTVAEGRALIADGAVTRG